MKRILSILLAAAMALSLAGCGERQAEVTPSPEATPTPTVTPAPTPTPVVLIDGLRLEISCVGPVASGQAGELYTVSEQGLDRLSTPLPDRLPVYVSKYPHSKASGPAYHMTEEMQEEALQKMLGYLRLLYPEQEEFDWTWLQYPHFRACTINDTTEVHAQIDQITLSIDGYALNEDVTDEALLEDPLVKTTTEYLGLEEPQVTGRRVEYSNDGTERSRVYEIAEPAEDPLTRAANLRFSGIRVGKSVMPDRDYTYISLYDLGEPELLREVPALPYETVWAGVKARIPDMRWQEELQIDPSTLKEEEVLCEIYYDYPPAYDYPYEGLIPYYRFYAKLENGESYTHICLEARIMEEGEP